MEKRVLTLLAAFMGGWLLNAALPVKTIFDKPHARVVETTYLPGVAREAGVRESDQVIIFVDECTYERKDPVTGELAIRKRAAGETIWHDKGEAAPQLKNVGKTPYRTITVELK